MIGVGIMLQEQIIDKLIQPIVNRQELMNTIVLEMLASKIGEIGQLSIEDLDQFQYMTTLGIDIQKLNRQLSMLSTLQITAIKNLIDTIAMDAYTDAETLYDYRQQVYLPYEQNQQVQQLVTTIGNNVSETYKKLTESKRIGFLIRDQKNPLNLKFHTINDTYKSVVNEAIQTMQSDLDYHTVMRRTLNHLVNSGVRKMFRNGRYSQKLTTIVKQDLLNGVRDIQQAVEDVIAEELETDGKELSVHANSALDHEPFQGHQFTNEEWEKLQNSEDFQDVAGESFSGVERIIGIWNCRHIAKSIFVGITKPQYTKEQLQKLIEDNHKGHILSNGTHLTLYECTQMQRQLENRIRLAKDEEIVLRKAGDSVGANIAKQKAKNLMQEYTRFSNECGLLIHKDRIVVTI